MSTKGEEINFPEWRSDYQSRISNTTNNNYLRNIHAFFRWLEETETIDKDPMRRIKQLPKHRTPKKFLTDEEVKGI